MKVENYNGCVSRFLICCIICLFCIFFFIRFACNSTFEQLKQSVEKAKAALQDRGSYLSSCDLGTSPFCPATPSSRTPVSSHPTTNSLDLFQDEQNNTDKRNNCKY